MVDLKFPSAVLRCLGAPGHILAGVPSLPLSLEVGPLYCGSVWGSA